MSEDRSLKNKFFGKVAPYVFAGLTVLVPFSSATAQDQFAAVPEGSSTKVSIPAKQAPAPKVEGSNATFEKASIPAPQPEFSVPLKDLSTHREKLVKRAAAGTSNDAIVVVFLGTDQDKLNQARAGASDAKNAGYPVVWMLQGPGNNEVIIFADGQEIELNEEEGASLAQRTEHTIGWAYEDVVKPRLTAATQTQPSSTR